MADADKLYNRTGTWGDSTLGDGDPVTPAYLGGVDTNALLLGRNRYTGGADVLAQPDCEIGATWAGPDGTLWFYRLDGTATSDDETRAGLASPLRAIWHYDDRDGEPETDGRSINGDLIIWDDGTNDRFLGVCTGSGVYGLGVRADYRTAATALAPDQASERLTMRSSRWDTSGTPAAQDREWSFYSHTSPSAGDGYSLLHVDRRHNGGSWTSVATLDTNGWLYLAGGVPGLEFNSGGAGSAFLRCYSSDPDGSLLRFGHGNGSRWARLRCYGTTTGATGTAAETLGVAYGSAATALATLRNSPSIALWASVWNSDGSVAVDLGSYEQLIPTSHTEAYVRRGFGSYGVGLLDLYSTGDLVLQVSTPANDDVSSPDKIVDSSNLVFRGHSWSGAASVDRDMRIRCFVASSADEGDVWAMLYDNGTTDAGGVLMDGTRMVGDAAANVLSFTLDAGTHPAVQSGTTKTTPGGVDAWLALDVNGTTYYVPAYTSKTA